MSIFDRITTTENPAVKAKSIFNNAVITPSKNIPIIIEDQEIDKIGEEVTQRVGKTTEKLISALSVSKFEDLGTILTEVQNEVDLLDPAKIQKSGIAGWVQRNFSNIKNTLTSRLNSAQQMFDKLEARINMHIQTHQDWIVNLEEIYKENYAHYRDLIQEINTTDSIISKTQAKINAWPQIEQSDPEAVMAAQLKRDAESRLNRLRGKRDNLFRLKTIAELNSPKIRQQQDSSRAAIATLKDVVGQTILMVKMEFALFMQTLDVQKTINLANNVKTFADKTLISSADTAKVAAVASATASNSPIVSAETLAHLRSRVLETVQEVKRIELETAEQRRTEYESIKQGQKQLLDELQTSGAVK